MGKLIFAVSKDIEKVSKDIEKDIARIMFNAGGIAQEKTPVDTGFARAGWDLTVRLPTGKQLQQKKKPKGHERGKNLYGEPTPILPRFKLGDSIYLINNVEYISYLDKGARGRTPLGIEAAVITYLESELSKAGK